MAEKDRLFDTEPIEQRCIGGTRVLLVKHYDGQSRPPPPGPPTLAVDADPPNEHRRCLLERRVSIPPVAQAPEDAPLRSPSPPSARRLKRRRSRSRMVATTTFGINGSVAAAAVGLWIFSKADTGGME